MLTDLMTQVDGSRSTDEGFWLSVSALATERRVSKQAISKNVHRWCAAGAVISTKQEGRQLLINVAEYDRAAGDHADAARQLGEETKKGGESNGTDPIYTREQARAKGYEADLKKLDLEERLGNLVPTTNVRDASINCAENISRIIDQLTNHSEKLANEAKVPIAAAKTFLKNMQRGLKTAISDELIKLAAKAVSPTMSSGEENFDE